LEISFSCHGFFRRHDGPAVQLYPSDHVFPRLGLAHVLDGRAEICDCLPGDFPLVERFAIFGELEKNS